MLENHATADLTEAEHALFAFLEKVNHDSARITREDVDRTRAAGNDDETIYDAITVCALFNFYNRWIDATGVQDMPAMAYEMSGQRLANDGYAK